MSTVTGCPTQLMTTISGSPVQLMTTVTGSPTQLIDHSHCSPTHIIDHSHRQSNTVNNHSHRYAHTRTRARTHTRCMAARPTGQNILSFYFDRTGTPRFTRSTVMFTSKHQKELIILVIIIVMPNYAAPS